MMETRRRGMPRMRSASMALLGLEETRISLSLSRTARILLLRESAKGTAEPLPQARRGGQPSQTFFQEVANATVDGGPGFAFRAKIEVGADRLLSFLAQSSVEKKVCNAFYFVTDHPVPS